MSPGSDPHEGTERGERTAEIPQQETRPVWFGEAPSPRTPLRAPHPARSGPPPSPRLGRPLPRHRGAGRRLPSRPSRVAGRS